MSNFDPQINQQSGNSHSYGRIFCNYPQRRFDYEINSGINSYHFNQVKFEKNNRQLNPIPKARNDGALNSYDKGSPLKKIRNYSTPYPKEKYVQNRTIGLNRDTRNFNRNKLSKSLPLRSTEQITNIIVPNPKIPVYNHIIPKSYVEKHRNCPCGPHTFQPAEHIWSNNTKLNGYDHRLTNIYPSEYKNVQKNIRKFPTKNIRHC